MESGVVGGIALTEYEDFGIALNPEAIIDECYEFDLYNGGVDIAFLGFAEVDAEGNVNVSKFGPILAGCGGFIDISQEAKKVVFCGTFTSHGLKIGVDSGNLHIRQEGKHKKFVKKVEQITFSGEYARRKKQPVVLVTERAVFHLEEAGWVLTEMAPGVDIEKHIFPHVDFEVRVARTLKKIEKSILTWGGSGISTS